MKARSVLGLVAGALLMSTAAPAAAQEACAGLPTGVKLTVLTSDLRNNRGQVAITVYPDDSRRFLARKGKLSRQRVSALRPRGCFWLPGPGVYAVAIYHDANANADFDRNPIGMPVEGFGFSNDPPTRFSLPAYEAVRFRVKPGDNVIQVRMRYP